MLDDWTEGECREEREAADDNDHTHDQADEQAARGREGASRGRNRLFGRERARDRHCRNDHPEPANQHRDGAGEIVEEGVASQAGESRAVIGGLRRISVEHLREPVRPRIRHRGDSRRHYDGDGRPAEIHQRQDQDGEHGHLDLLRLNFLADILGRAPTIRPATKIARMTNSSMPYMPAPTPPTMISPSCMLISGIMPPSAVKASCIALTAPHEAAVVTTANSAEATMPNRTSLPSMLPPVRPMAVKASLPCASAQ